MEQLARPLTLLRRDEVKRRTGLSTSSLYQLMKEGELARPVKLTGGTVAWPEHEIEAFIRKRIEARKCTSRIMSVDKIIAVLDGIDDRASLIAFLAPLRLPTGLPEFDQARLSNALMAAASRAWKGRISG